MSQRRDFLKKSSTMVVGMMAGIPAKVFAFNREFPNGLIYTKQNPGRWSKNANEHAPVITLEGKKITIFTPHPMTVEHYIVRHTLVAEDGKVLGDKTFYPPELTASSTSELPEKPKSKLYATSFCNLHDYWVTEFKP